jgi:hypothetical protein
MGLSGGPTPHLSYAEMCGREGTRLRRGMHFGRGGRYSVLLMSVRPRAPYRDRFEDGGSTLIYEGHDAPQRDALPDPKAVDQPLLTAYGTPTQNARFYEAAQAYARGQRPAELVKVYEKCRPGLWLYHGVFQLVDAWRESDGRRQVFKFRLVATGEAADDLTPAAPPRARRRIPARVKAEVWRRDGGRCVVCGATERLHYDHIVPVADGGASVADNLQLLCARHNLAKGAKSISLVRPGDSASATSALPDGGRGKVHG